MYALVKGPRTASASWPAYSNVQSFAGAAELSGHPVLVSKYVIKLVSDYVQFRGGV